MTDDALIQARENSDYRYLDAEKVAIVYRRAGEMPDNPGETLFEEDVDVDIEEEDKEVTHASDRCPRCNALVACSRCKDLVDTAREQGVDAVDLQNEGVIA